MLAAELGVTHPLGIFFKVRGLGLNSFAQFRGGVDDSQRADQLFDLAIIEFVLLTHDPTFLLGILAGVEFASQVPKMLTGMIEVDNLDRTGEVFIGDIPDPFGSIANDDFLLRAAPTTPGGFQIDAFSKFSGGHG